MASLGWSLIRSLARSHERIRSGYHSHKAITAAAKAMITATPETSIPNVAATDSDAANRDSFLLLCILTILHQREIVDRSTNLLRHQYLQGFEMARMRIICARHAENMRI
tara:strand:- start:3166 stop:3495 length:330 start_codon:yes stop_codon:yes gene_type:complete